MSLLFTEAVLKNTAFQTTEIAVHNVTKVWLRNSADRDGGRTKRAVKRHMGMAEMCFKPLN